MRRAGVSLVLAATVGLLAGAGAGCTYHHSPISRWYFYDRQTGEPIEKVLLLEWSERNRSRSAEAQAFEAQVPMRENLAEVRAVWLTADYPSFTPAVPGSVQSYAMNWAERSRYMACCPGYAFRVSFASQEELARLEY